jgi:hypothetical protein
MREEATGDLLGPGVPVDDGGEASGKNHLAAAGKKRYVAA